MVFNDCDRVIRYLFLFVNVFTTKYERENDED